MSSNDPIRAQRTARPSIEGTDAPAPRARPLRRLALLLAACTLAVACLAAGRRIAATAAPRGLVADSLVVDKSERRLELWSRGKAANVYSIALGGNPVDPKRCEGDGRTPEGRYRISGRNPNTAYHRSLRISYPDAADRRDARRLGCLPGGDVMIHGLAPGFGWLGAAHRLRDWTRGCIAVTDGEIEELWKAVPDGTPIVIRP